MVKVNQKSGLKAKAAQALRKAGLHLSLVAGFVSVAATNPAIFEIPTPTAGRWTNIVMASGADPFSAVPAITHRDGDGLQ